MTQTRKLNYAQFLYDEVKPDFGNFISGEELNKILPILSNLDCFVNSKLEIVDRCEIDEDVSPAIPVVRDLHSVILTENMIGKPTVKIYSVLFWPGFYRHAISKPDKEGVYSLPAYVSENQFHTLVPILAYLDIDKLYSRMTPRDPIIEPKGFLTTSTKRSLDEVRGEVFGELVGEFSAKLYKILSYLHDGEKSLMTEYKADLPKHGQVIIRMTPDSYTLNGDNEYTNVNSPNNFFLVK